MEEGKVFVAVPEAKEPMGVGMSERTQRTHLRHSLNGHIRRHPLAAHPCVASQSSSVFRSGFIADVRRWVLRKLVR
jgi:hypothetical protein